MMVHNFVVLACIVQLCIVYFFSGCYQLMGELWQSGTAIYYISQVDEFSRPILQHLTENYLIVTIIFSYLSIITKLAFPFTILNKKVKPFMVASMVFFHGGIGIGMGLLTFSIVMICMECLVFTDSEYQKMYQNTLRWIRYRQLVMKRATRKFGFKYLRAQQIIVFYDGWCPMCRGIVKRIDAMDYFRLIRCVSFRMPNIIDTYQLDPQEVELRMHSIGVNGGMPRKGISSVVHISQKLIPLWVVLPFIAVSKWLGIGGYVYDYIAKNRKLIPVNHCNDSCEITPTVK
ncbi:hypothetical protein BK126_19795 [Paenibacillus sp. FSL H7-0326]|nr:hypothetical protein BK126_19795 [Paenibacillus sp. FSL H7-0326]